MHDGNLIDSVAVSYHENKRKWITQIIFFIALVLMALTIFTWQEQSTVNNLEYEYAHLKELYGQQTPAQQQTSSQVSLIYSFIQRRLQNPLKPLLILRPIINALLPGEKVISFSMSKEGDSLELIVADKDRITPFVQQLLKIPAYKSVQMTSLQMQENLQVQVGFVMQRQGKKGLVSDGN